MNKAFVSQVPPVGEGSLRVLSDTGIVVTAEMSIEEWIALPDHPRQRDTERQARKAHWQYAKRARGAVLESLRQVVAAKFKGVLYKVDGHTRGYLWEQGVLRPPKSVFATIYRVETELQLNQLYTTFDNASAAESQYDKVAGAFRECGLTLRSKRLRYGFMVTALNIALRGSSRAHQDKKRTPPIDIYKAVGVFKEELKLLDSVDPQPEVFYNGVIAAGLIGLSLYAEQAIGFFQKLSALEGNKREGMMDPIEAVLTHISSIKKERSAWVTAQQEDLCRRTLQALLAWLDGDNNEQYWVKVTLPAVEDLGPYIAELKNKKGIMGDRTL